MRKNASLERPTLSAAQTSPPAVQGRLCRRLPPHRLHIKRVQEWQLAMYGRLFFGPPNVRLALQRSGRRMKPIALPAGLNTITPSRSSPWRWATHCCPAAPQVAIGIDAEAVDRNQPLASTTTVRLEMLPSAPTSRAAITRFGVARDSRDV